jgi:hypothetical protein
MADVLSAAVQLWLIVFGALVAGHYHCTANFITKAPLWVKIMTALVTAAGTGMIFCGLVGDIGHGALFALFATGPMVAVQLGALQAGVSISEQFRVAALIKQMGWRFVRDQQAMAEVARLAADSDYSRLAENEQKSR